MPVARDGREARDAGIAHEVVDLGALDVGRAVIAAAEAGIAGARPGLASGRAGRFCGSARKSSVPGELPQIFQVAREVLQAIEKPRLLRRARASSAAARPCGSSAPRSSPKRMRRRRMAAGVGAAGVEDLHRLLAE